jgi:hypothetical protein
VKITETVSRECCNGTLDLKPIVGPGKPCGRKWYFCQHCGRWWEDQGGSEPESPGLQAVPWPWQIPAPDSKRCESRYEIKGTHRVLRCEFHAGHTDEHACGDWTWPNDKLPSRPVTPPESILCGKEWEHSSGCGVEICRKPKGHEGVCCSGIIADRGRLAGK